MKKLLILTVCLILTVTAIGQTDTQRTCYDFASQFITDTYATVITDEESEYDRYIIIAEMAIGYSNYIVKIDMKNCIETYQGLKYNSTWHYDEQMESIVCSVLVKETEEVIIIYSVNYNTITFYFKWEK